MKNCPQGSYRFFKSKVPDFARDNFPSSHAILHFRNTNFTTGFLYFEFIANISTVKVWQK